MKDPNDYTEARVQRNSESVITVAAEFYDVRDLGEKEIYNLMRSSAEKMHDYLRLRPMADCPDCGGRFSCYGGEYDERRCNG